MVAANANRRATRQLALTLCGTLGVLIGQRLRAQPAFRAGSAAIFSARSGASVGFANYRIRVLLYAGKPNWDLLRTIAPR